MQSLTRLKQLLRAKGLQYYILPKNDEFMNQSLPADRDRLMQITGFTGSSGYAVISAKDDELSTVVTDSRYELQIADEVNTAHFEFRTDAMPVSKCLSGKEGAVAIDAKLFSHGQVDVMKEKVAGLSVNHDDVLLDQVSGRKDTGSQKFEFFEHGKEYSGITIQEKLLKVVSEMEVQKVQALHISMLEEIAWLLNLRMLGEHEFNPLFNA